MSHNLLPEATINYRAVYGKLFSGLLNQFGADYISEIEDAIQNSFLKSLKTWKPGNLPAHQENWLFIVARNDVLNQLKARQRQNNNPLSAPAEGVSTPGNKTDLRLQTIIFIASLEIISNQAKILFILKNIFGLSIAEISNCTLTGEEAAYKSIHRAKKSIQQEFKGKKPDLNSVKAHQKAISVTEEIFYAVFNIGFDSFNEKTAGIVNKDLCLEAFALTKLLLAQYQHASTSNLLALFCFHIARISAKTHNGKLIPFFSQDRKKWNKELISAGFHYLKKPVNISRIYIEAIIISRYMTVHPMTENEWHHIIKLYEIMQQVSPSPIVKLNYCYCLSRVGKTRKALDILSAIEKELPGEHLYFSLVKAKILKETQPRKSAGLFIAAVNKMKQEIRKEYLLENELIQL